MQATTDLSNPFVCSRSFYRRCGNHVATRISRDTESVLAIDLACVDAIDLALLSPRLFDGATDL